MTNLTLIIPAKNEKESLPSVLEELRSYQYKIKIILEQSDKETIESIKYFDCDLIFQDKKGYGNALIRGIESVDTEYFCIFNADGSFNPNELINMLTLRQSNDYDFIFASRYEKNCGSDDDTVVTFLGNFIFTLLGKIFFKLTITDILYTFVLGKSSQAKKLKLKQVDFGFCVELPIRAQRNRMKLGTSKSYERKRIGGTKKVNAFKDGFKILNCMFKLFFKNEI
jgi:glycosyltransferase involved in cell wall biosynthesis